MTCLSHWEARIDKPEIINNSSTLHICSYVGVFISGENEGVVNTLLTLWKSLNRQEKMGKLQDAWSHPHINTQGVLCTMQLYVKQILGEYNSSSTHIIGFKEIRHVKAEQLNFFRVLFPCARFIINTRQDLKAQAKSGFYKRNRNSLIALKNDTHNILQWAASIPDNKHTLFHLPTERFTVVQFNRLLEWIGVRNCHFTDLHHSHNKNSFHPDNRAEILAGRNNCSILTKK